MNSNALQQVHLRRITQDDLPRLYEWNLDAEANAMAATIPRPTNAFNAHWAKALSDPNVTAKAILVGDTFAGSISCFEQTKIFFIGYWLDKKYWGQGIASRALQLLLQEVSVRPLHAHVATSNQASLRVLQKSGFVIQSVQHSAGTDRYLECEEALLVLK